MFRVVFYLLITVVAITVVRSVIGILMKAMADAFAPPASRTAARRPPQDVPLTGELKRDPVCGTYTAANSALTHSARGQTYYFCSPACRDKFVGRGI